jgi:hypothetical protein
MALHYHKVGPEARADAAGGWCVLILTLCTSAFLCDSAVALLYSTFTAAPQRNAEKRRVGFLK